MKVVIIIPVYNECPTLEPLVEGIAEHIGPHEHRILFVDDGSTDGSYEVLTRLRAEKPSVDFIKFRTNCGKTRALASAFDRAQGDVVVTMDGDLQDDPKELPRMFAKLDEGYDLVCGWKRTRHDPLTKVIPSRIYNKCVSWIFGLALHDINTGFKAMRMEVAKRLPLYSDMHRLIPVFAAHLGYHITEIPVEHHPRLYGKSKYGFERYARGAIDAFIAWFLTTHGDAPGRFFTKAGAVQGFVGLMLAVLAVVLAGVWPHPLFDLALLMAGLLGVLAGMGCFGAGILAELLIHRVPPPSPDVHIEEEHM